MFYDYTVDSRLFEPVLSMILFNLSTFLNQKNEFVSKSEKKAYGLWVLKMFKNV